MANQREAPRWDSLPGAETREGVWAPNRGPVYGRRYAVATDQPIASLTAMEVMQKVATPPTLSSPHPPSIS